MLERLGVALHILGSIVALGFLVLGVFLFNASGEGAWIVATIGGFGPAVGIFLLSRLIMWVLSGR